MSSIRRRSFAALTLGLVLGAAAPFAAGAATLDGLPVEVENRSEPVLCAEKDNVTIAMSSPEVRRFQIEAVHPAYVGAIVKDNWNADWTACNMEGDPSFPAAPRRTTFYESIDLWLVGYTFPSFWRPNSVPIRVGDRTESGFHLIQLWVLTKDRAEEVLVLYPADGYWRARPLPPEHLRGVAYGSSFLVGPIEDKGRPVVDLKDIAFDPATRAFTLNFTKGGSAVVRVDTLDVNQMVLDVTLDRAVTGSAFAALRSMYVTEFNADVARIAVREPDAKGWREEPIMSFGRARATDVWTGRLSPSRHNTSAPDTVFRGFRGAEAARPEPAATSATPSPARAP